MPTCVVECCNNYHLRVKKCDGITFHRFPSGHHDKTLWESIIQKCRDEPEWRSSKSSVVCSMHFEKKDFYKTAKGLRRLVPHAFPKLLLTPESVPVPSHVVATVVLSSECPRSGTLILSQTASPPALAAPFQSQHPSGLLMCQPTQEPPSPMFEVVTVKSEEPPEYEIPVQTASPPALAAPFQSQHPSGLLMCQPTQIPPSPVIKIEPEEFGDDLPSGSCTSLQTTDVSQLLKIEVIENGADQPLTFDSPKTTNLKRKIDDKNMLILDLRKKIKVLNQKVRRLTRSNKCLQDKVKQLTKKKTVNN